MTTDVESNNETSSSPTPERRHKSLRFSWSRQWRLTKKELAETLRDRRTIFTLVLMPILVYPLLSLVFRQFVVSNFSKQGEASIIIGVPTEEEGRQLRVLLKEGEKRLQGNADNNESEQEPPLVDEPDAKRVKMIIGASQWHVEHGDIDILLRDVSNSEQRLAWQITFSGRSTLTASARSFVERRLRAMQRAIAHSPARETPGSREEPPRPSLELTYRELKASGEPKSLLPTMVPLVLLLMTITGAVYPAIDLTAGERERGTLEALMAAPVSRYELLLAKYCAVFVVAMLTAGVNLLAMTITVEGSGLSKLLFGEAGLTPWQLLQILALLLLFASFFAAVLLAITSFARSFKEAQAYLIPIMLVTLAPGLMSLSPNLRLEGPLAVVPLVNVVLMSRDVFLGQGTWLLGGVVSISTLIYAAVALRVAANVFGSDAILYGSNGSWSTLWKRHGISREFTSPRLVTWSTALALAGVIALGGAVQQWTAPWGIATELWAAAGVTLLLFFVLPRILAFAERAQATTTFRYRWGAFRFWLAALLLGLSAGVLLIEFTLWSAEHAAFDFGESFRALAEQRARQLEGVPLLVIALTLACIPAWAEEHFFRGYMQTSYEQTFGAATGLVVAALVFGLFHAVGAVGITWQRFLPSLVLGGLLGLLAQRSGSLFPGMITHAVNNFGLLLLGRYREELVEWKWLAADSRHLPWEVVCVAALGLMLSLVLILWPRRRDSESDV